MLFLQPASELMRLRYSCRTYTAQPIAADKRTALENFIRQLPDGPFNSGNRYLLVAADSGDGQALRGLGTYGAIRNPAAFAIGAVSSGHYSLEDFGYQMELIVLQATGLGLGSCWLGGNFTRSTFNRRMQAAPDEIIPAVCSLGIPQDGKSMVDRAFRMGAGSDRRYPWEKLFFGHTFGSPLTPEAAGAYALPLEMVRIAPSASNKQPWRVVKGDGGWHFYLQRTSNYPGGLVTALLHVADMQRIDMGIAMSHFELAAAEAGLRGSWQVNPPAMTLPDALASYLVSWVPQGGQAE